MADLVLDVRRKKQSAGDSPAEIAKTKMPGSTKWFWADLPPHNLLKVRKKGVMFIFLIENNEHDLFFKYLSGSGNRVRL